MSYAQCEFDATDEAGNLLSNVSVEVRRQPGLTLEPLYSDREGASNKANPFTATDGKVKFFAAGGAFRIVLTAGSYTRTRDYVAVGRAAETDLLLTSPKGAWSSGSTYSKGDLVSVVVGTITRLFASVQNSNTNHTPDSTTPGDTSWWMYVGTVAGTASAPGITLTYDSTTSAADPGNGKFRLNNATHSSATALYADNVEALAGASITSLLDSWDDSTNTVKGTLKIAKASDPTVFRIYTISGSVVDSTGYRTITISYVTGAGSLSNGDQCLLIFLRAGDKGSIGGSTGATDNRLLRSDGTGGATVQASAITVDDSGNMSGVGTFNGYTPREVLTANRTYYVRTDGNDSNNGLSNTSGGAFLTVQKAINVALALDMSIYTTTISIGSGSFAQNLSIAGNGNARIVLTGAGYTATTIGSGSSTQLLVSGGASVTIADLALAGGGSVSLWCRYGAQVFLAGSVRFNSATARQIDVDLGGYIESTSGTIYLNGNAPYFLYADPGGQLNLISGVTIVTESARTYTDVVRIQTGEISLGGSITWNVASGAVTARKYNVTLNGVLNAAGSSSNIPGGTAGITATGGQVA